MSHPNRAFSYTSDRGGVRVYVVWSGPDGTILQLVIGPAPLGQVTTGVEDQGTVVDFNAIERGSLVQSFAPSLSDLREATQILRPDQAPQ